MAHEILALGSTIERSIDNGATWVKYDAPKTLTVPTVTQEYIEITSLDSTHGFREYQNKTFESGVLFTPSLI